MRGLKAANIEEVLALPDEEIDIATAALLLSKKWDDTMDIEEYRKQIDEMAASLKPIAAKAQTPDSIVKAVNDYIFEESKYDVPESANFASVLRDATKTDEKLFLLHSVLDAKSGDALGLSVLYLSLVERLNLPIYGVTVPGHFLVRYDDNETRINIETADSGKSYSDAYYTEEFKVPAETLYLTNLSKKQTIGCFLTSLGVAYANQDKLEEAIAEFKTAISVNPNYAKAHYCLGVAYDGNPSKQAEAIAEYKAAISINPNYAQAHNNLGNLYKDQCNLQDAMAEWRAAISAKPDLPQPHYNLANAYENQGKPEEAIAELKAAINAAPNEAHAHYNLAIAYGKQNRQEESAAEYKAAISINPDYAEAHNNLGNIYRDQGKLAEAIAEYKSAIEANSDLPQPRYNMARIHKDNGELDDAIREWQEVIRIKPDSVDGHHFLGHSYFDKDMFDEAIAEWKITVELIPDDARLYRDLRNAHFKAGKLDELIDETEQRLEADASDARGHYLLALSLAEKWEIERAIESFRKATELDPPYEAAHSDYIDLMKSRGRHAEARAEYKEKAESQPDNELWSKLLERVPATRKLNPFSKCALCVESGALKLVYLQFILLAGISVIVASFARELTSSQYLALAIYAAIISAIHSAIRLPFVVADWKNRFRRASSMMPNIDLSAATVHIINVAAVLITHFKFAPIAILVYVAMQIFHANWWLPIAALSIPVSIVRGKMINASWNYSMKGKPIEDPILAERLTKLIERSGVKVKEILRIDTDKPHSQASVSGILASKRILISDAMLRRLSIPEVEAVFAHELGHVKANTMRKKFFTKHVLTFVRLYLANLIYGAVIPVYGFSGPEQFAALPLLVFCWLILGPPVRAVQSWVSRRFEQKADQYAISVVGRSAFLSAFSKLPQGRQDSFLSSIVSFVCHSHPCREKRL